AEAEGVEVIAELVVVIGADEQLQAAGFQCVGEVGLVGAGFGVGEDDDGPAGQAFEAEVEAGDAVDGGGGEADQREARVVGRGGDGDGDVERGGHGAGDLHEVGAGGGEVGLGGKQHFQGDAFAGLGRERVVRCRAGGRGDEFDRLRVGGRGREGQGGEQEEGG